MTVRMLRFCRRAGRFFPTNGAASFEAPVDTGTGEIVEPTPEAAQPPPHEPDLVLRWLALDAERAAERAAVKRARREREKRGVLHHRELADALAADEQETP